MGPLGFHLYMSEAEGGSVCQSETPCMYPARKAAWLVEDSHARNCPLACSRGILGLDKYKFPAEVGYLEFLVVTSIDAALWLSGCGRSPFFY